MRMLWGVVVGVALVLGGCDRASEPAGPDVSASAPSPADVQAARAAARALGSGLQSQLRAALENEGAVSAIGVCNHAAPAVAASVAEDAGLSVGRTSLRLRNPANAPTAWERRQLVAFADAQAAGADLTSLEHAAVVAEDGARVFRWMKPIVMGAMCAQCHGEAIAPEVATAIAALYPNDQAVGFAQGDVRGAFTVSKVLEPVVE